MARRPVNSPYTITTEFGVPDSYAKFGRHSGVDYAVNAGRPVYAPASGNLTNVVSPTGGNMVVIHDGQFYHRLMHNSSFSRGNGAVSEGAEVAKAGTTGLSTGVHCHWDINNQGTYPTAFSAFINPNDWLKQEGEEPMLNEGDVVNIYYHLQQPLDDTAKKFWGNGKHTWKELFDALINSKGYVQSRIINDGDVVNVGKAVKADASSLKGRLWGKDTFYDFIQPNLQK